MSAKVYSLEVVARLKGTVQDRKVTAQLDESGSGVRKCWWFAVKVGGQVAAKGLRFPFASSGVPPFASVNAVLVKQVAEFLGVQPNRVAYADDFNWKLDE